MENKICTVKIHWNRKVKQSALYLFPFEGYRFLLSNLHRKYEASFYNTRPFKSQEIISRFQSSKTQIQYFHLSIPQNGTQPRFP